MTTVADMAVLVNLGTMAKSPTPVEMEVKNSTNRVQSLKLVAEAVTLQLAENDSDPSEVEKCLTMALDLDPGSLEALQEAARFYDSVSPDREKARKYAATCRDRAAEIIFEMEQILGRNRSGHETDSKLPASRHIGGIIGPY